MVDRKIDVAKLSFELSVMIEALRIFRTTDTREVHLNASQARTLTAVRDALTSLAERVRELEGALKPFADRCNEEVRAEDTGDTGLFVKVKHLCAARAALCKSEGGAS